MLDIDIEKINQILQIKTEEFQLNPNQNIKKVIIYGTLVVLVLGFGYYFFNTDTGANIESNFSLIYQIQNQIPDTEYKRILEILQKIEETPIMRLKYLNMLRLIQFQNITNKKLVISIENLITDIQKVYKDVDMYTTFN